MIAYILKVTLCWLFFYGVYELFLKKRTFFIANRTYLMSTLLIGILLPLLEFIPWKTESNMAYVIYPVLMEIDDLQAIAVEATNEQRFSWLNALSIVYALGVIISLIRFIFGVNKIMELFRASEKLSQKGYTLVLTDKAHLPFSFFNWVFLSKKMDLTDEVEQVMEHEIEHIKGRHSLDVLVTEFLKVIFWCSPMIYFYKNALREVHEFLADHIVVKSTDKLSYKKLLLKQTNNSLQLALTHQFFNSHLKNRLKMINQKRSGRPTLVMYALGIPVLLLLLFAFTAAFDTSKIDNPDPEVPVLIENIGDYFMETDSEKAPYFQINGKDIDLPLFKHISLYSFGGSTDVLLPEKAVELFGDKAKLGYVNFRNPSLKNGDSSFDAGAKSFEIYSQATRDRKYHELAGTFSRAERPEGYIPSAGKKLEKMLMAGITDKVSVEMTESERAPHDYVKEYDTPALMIGCEDKDLTNAEAVKCSYHQMVRILQENISYPEQAEKYGIEGSVTIKAIITEKGKLIDPQIALDLGGNCGEAALEAVKKLANEVDHWVPAMKDGKAVPSKLYLPVTFTLGDHVNSQKLKSEEDVLWSPEIAKKVYKQIQLRKDNSTININYNRILEKDTIPKPKTYEIKGEIFKVVQQMPRFPGCEKMDGDISEKEECAKQKMLEYIYTNVKYPNEARAKRIEGMSVVQFVVTKSGDIAKVKLLRDVGGTTGEESMRVVESMNNLGAKWTPGTQEGKAVNVQYTLPIKYVLQGSQKTKESPKDDAGEKEKITVVAVGNTKIVDNNEVTTLKADKIVFDQDDSNFNNSYIIVDNVHSDHPLSKISPDKIESVTILKGNKALEMYGEKGKNGVILIYTKDYNGPKKYIEEGKVKQTDSYELADPILKSQSGLMTKENEEEALDGKKSDPENKSIVLRSSTPDESQQPLFIIDGEEKEQGIGKELYPDDIKHINVLKGEKAHEKYGDKALNGVVEITTKKGKSEQKKKGSFNTNDVDQLAFFPGCSEIENLDEKKNCSNKKLLEFIYSNLKYPKEAASKGIEGIVITGFTITKEGRVTQIKLKRDVEGLGDEALRVVALMNEKDIIWEPALLDGNPVAMEFVLPMKYKLADECLDCPKKVDPKINSCDEIEDEVERNKCREEKITVVKKALQDVNSELRNDANTLEIEDFKAFPNPAKNHVNVSFKSNGEPTIVKLVDLDGRIIFEEKLNGFNGTYDQKLTLEGISSKIVILNITQNEKVFSKKILIE